MCLRTHCFQRRLSSLVQNIQQLDFKQLLEISNFGTKHRNNLYVACYEVGGVVGWLGLWATSWHVSRLKRKRTTWCLLAVLLLVWSVICLGGWESIYSKANHQKSISLHNLNILCLEDTGPWYLALPAGKIGDSSIKLDMKLGPQMHFGAQYQSEGSIQLLPKPWKMVIITPRHRTETWQTVPVATWCSEWICRMRGASECYFLGYSLCLLCYLRLSRCCEVL